MNTFKVDTLEEGMSFSDDLYLDEGYILMPKGAPLSARLLQTLKSWGYREILSNGTPVLPQPDSETSIEARFALAFDWYQDFISWTGSVYDNMLALDELDFASVLAHVNEARLYVTKNRSQILAALESGKSTDMANYLPRHNTEVCILSLCIGNLLKYNSSALNELGASALLHEAGMVKLPSEIYLTQEELGKKERQALGMHPLLGYQVLRHYNVPDGVCRPALEHHERQNGSGYPRKLHGNAITFNSRIIALCCAYEAMGAKRPYRDPQDSHRSLMELLQNPDNEFDPAVLKSLTSVLSLYPVGTLVMLSNGRQARVLASNTATPRYPLVQYLDGKEEIIKTEEYGISVARPLLPNERKV